MEARKEDYVLRTVEERGVRLIRLWFTDVLGQLKSLAISPAELEAAFDEGLHFDGSAIDGDNTASQNNRTPQHLNNTARRNSMQHKSKGVGGRGGSL